MTGTGLSTRPPCHRGRRSSRRWPSAGRAAWSDTRGNQPGTPSPSFSHAAPDLHLDQQLEALLHDQPLQHQSAREGRSLSRRRISVRREALLARDAAAADPQTTGWPADADLRFGSIIFRKRVAPRFDLALTAGLWFRRGRLPMLVTRHAAYAAVARTTHLSRMFGSAETDLLCDGARPVKHRPIRLSS